MWLKRISAGLIVTAIGVVSVATLAAASESFADGTYMLVLPGVGDFEFEINSDGTVDGETVIAIAAPEGYVVDDDHPDKATWEDSATLHLEVEAKSDKVKGDYDWGGGDAMLMLPDGGSITITEPDEDGNFEVTTTGDWWAFGSGKHWFVANNPDPSSEEAVFFEVKADEDEIEIKPKDGPSHGFSNDLDDEDDEDES